MLLNNKSENNISGCYEVVYSAVKKFFNAVSGPAVGQRWPTRYSLPSIANGGYTST